MSLKMGEVLESDMQVMLQYPQTYTRFASALAVTERVMQQNNPKYRDKWRQQSIRHHLWHVIRHLFLYFIGDLREAHLAHGLTRFHMAAQLSAERREQGTFLPEVLR